MEDDGVCFEEEGVYGMQWTKIHPDERGSFLTVATSISLLKRWRFIDAIGPVT